MENLETLMLGLAGSRGMWALAGISGAMLVTSIVADKVRSYRIHKLAKQSEQE